ncbi:Cu(I)/Ag(I) efflux system membrane fusion protein [Variovorax beijingensis]|uniref:Cu(I)/Ag(I) efflux system membrane fusion protein n=2 Tax=Variovorax TaxID=34072 RepID=A0AAE3XY57_VARPD|nr:MULTISPECIES: efflux RND transporter periplasmic adaptor subunit [Variovorax]MDP9964838.1 Cu(I)/Ag(I) efflux system membrane fusion protein [Variovorax paradoxus]MDR6427738.1 Cu(I)/Ag(I) efflux system membrane fusion protein [Variovorax paradoxus]MDR6454900.1 Cu(I)/Ag(I) efflux system membrane fusion protein [Variovorax paradoxus]TWD76378.1 Cu(I)/Ag(I) efflux system membrane fusion protein [Variovorax beijingensis]
MNRKLSAGVSLLAALLFAAGAFYLGRKTGQAADAPTAAATPDGRKVLYWHDPMVPGPRFDKPGKSPFMDMQLVPVYADNATGTASDAGVKISPAAQQNLGIRYAQVRRTEASTSFEAIGSVQFDERLNAAVQTRVAGYVERLSVRAPMERVHKGQALATIFAPDWLGPQNEWLALRRSGVSPDLVAAARDRMRALSIPAELIRRSEETGTAQARYVLAAPVDGVVAELGVREGAAVTPGMTLFRIAGLQKVWAVAEIPEAQALGLARGQKAKAVVQADASQSFDGVLDEILPEINTATRTLKARFEVDNRSGKLTPGMLLRLQVAGPAGSRLVVPSEAMIRTGRRTVVIVRRTDGAFEPRDVSTAADVGDDTEVVSGLTEGEQVVASGQFLIDSEARLRSVLGNMAAPAATSGASASASAVVTHRAEGKVESVAPDGITISHGPVATLQWPAMTMGFGKASPSVFPEIKPGDPVRFEFREGGPMGYELVSIQRLPSGAGK